MFNVFGEVGLQLMAAMVLVSFGAGLIKGVVGFAMPMVFISGLTFFVAPDFALGVLILPTLLTNFWQAFRNGIKAVLNTITAHWKFLTISCSILLAVTQVVPFLSTSAFFMGLGVVVISFAVLMLTGWLPKGRLGGWIDAGCAVVAGGAGGMAGVWGPPTVVYLAAKNLGKSETMQIQGVIYGLGAVFLTFGHAASGIFNAQTASIGAAVSIPAILGIWAGFKIQDLIDQKTFRRAMLIILIIAGFNLIRRGLF